MSWLPLYHDMGLIGGCFATMYLGFPVVLMSPLAFLARPSSWLRAIHRHRGTISGGPNFAYELCLRRIPDDELEGLDLSTLALRLQRRRAGEPGDHDRLRQKIREVRLQPQLDVAGLRPGRVLGRPGVHAAGRARGSRPASTARPSRAAARRCRRAKAIRRRSRSSAAAARSRTTSCAWSTPRGSSCPTAREGPLQFRGPSATTGYYRNPEATKGLFDGEWLNTGDRAYLADGELYITGREKDIIIRGGRNISPYELEEAVGDMPGVRRGCVAVFGSQDAASGTERIVVLAETRESDAAPQRS